VPRGPTSTIIRAVRRSSAPASNGVVSFNGTPFVTVAHQWLRDGDPVGPVHKANHHIYTAVDVGRVLQCVAIAPNQAGTTLAGDRERDRDDRRPEADRNYHPRGVRLKRLP
jgi:hypothetical protein